MALQYIEVGATGSNTPEPEPPMDKGVPADGAARNFDPIDVQPDGDVVVMSVMNPARP